MAAHGLARRARRAVADRREDPAMLFLDELEVSLAAAHAFGQPAHRTPRYEMPADELQKARELGIAGGIRNGAVKGEVLIDRRFARGRGALDRLERSADRLDLRTRSALRGEAG